MGFDLSGINAKNDQGEYFRNNCWWWRRLWAFVCEHTPGVTQDDYQHGSSNDGYAIKGKKHWNMILFVKSALENKEKYEKWIKASDSKDYPFSWENVEEFYGFLVNNDGFRIH